MREKWTFLVGTSQLYRESTTATQYNTLILLATIKQVIFQTTFIIENISSTDLDYCGIGFDTIKKSFEGVNIKFIIAHLVMVLVHIDNTNVESRT